MANFKKQKQYYFIARKLSRNGSENGLDSCLSKASKEYMKKRDLPRLKRQFQAINLNYGKKKVEKRVKELFNL